MAYLSFAVVGLCVFVMYVFILAFGRPLVQLLRTRWAARKSAPTLGKPSDSGVTPTKESKPLSHWENRVLLKRALTEAYKHGLFWRGHKITDKNVKNWAERTRALIEAALGEDEAHRFLAINEDTFGESEDAVHDLWMDQRLDRLGQLIRLVDSLKPLKLQPDFDGRGWVSQKFLTS